MGVICLVAVVIGVVFYFRGYTDKDETGMGAWAGIIMVAIALMILS